MTSRVSQIAGAATFAAGVALILTVAMTTITSAASPGLPTLTLALNGRSVTVSGATPVRRRERRLHRERQDTPNRC